jgi:hypothetical protein
MSPPRPALIALMAMIILLPGCYGASLITGVSEPDLSILQPSGRRSLAEALLGTRLWEAGSAGGLTYDIYQYKAAQPIRPITGALFLGLDYVTAGLLEFDVRDTARNAPAKQVAIGYDDQNRVRFMSQPWSLSGGTIGACRRMRSLIPADAGVPPDAHPTATSGTPSADATLELEKGIFTKIDGQQVSGGTTSMSPGPHSVNYSNVPGGGVMVSGLRIIHFDATFENVTFLAGRHYRLKSTRLYVGFESTEDLFWIEDSDSDEVLACSINAIQ